MGNWSVRLSSSRGKQAVAAEIRDFARFLLDAPLLAADLEQRRRVRCHLGPGTAAIALPRLARGHAAGLREPQVGLLAGFCSDGECDGKDGDS